ncbi:long-chain-fatty-acid-CoA-ligase [Panaeolus papilionaceus]|nr:long-chain-fatty-acid-CoA-ligase [Panaeolus papilionaceus]
MSSSSFGYLTTGLPLRPDFFGKGSVEVSPPAGPNEGGVRRLAISSGKLVESPAPGVYTIPDLVDHAVQKYGEKYSAVGWRELIRTHEEQKEIVKVVGGREVKETKVWKLAELGPYQFLNYIEFDKKIQSVAAGLVRVGIKKEHILNMYSQTSVNWQLVSHASILLSTTIATAYDTLGVDGLQHSLNEPESHGLFTNAELLPVLLKVLPNTSHLKVVIYDGTATSSTIDSLKSTRPDITFIHLDDLMTLGSTLDPESFASELKARRPTPDTLACIMYTSGSTGAPKGVCLTHSNLVASVGSISLVFGPHIRHDQIYLAYLPLAHVLEFIVELAALSVGITSGYARPKTLTDAGVKNCRGDLAELKPHIMFGVPSVWETIRKGIVGKVESGSFVKRALFNGALAAKRAQTPFLSSLGEKVVLSKVKEATGGRLAFAMNGGAPISEASQEFLSLTVVPIFQGYGMTESCGMCCLLPPEVMRFGAVGLPVPSLEIKFLDMPEAGYLSSNSPPQGEICIRGPSLTKGYYKRPDLNNDETIFTKDGWFRTGDIGQWNEDGTISIIDRLKNLVKLQHGEYIALEQLEVIYKSSNFVSNLCVHATSGATRPLAIIIPHEANLRQALKSSPKLANLAQEDLATLCRHDGVKSLVLSACVELGKKNGFKPVELICGVVLTAEEWTPENGLVTAAQKVARNKIAKTFETEIKEIYAMN